VCVCAPVYKQLAHKNRLTACLNQCKNIHPEYYGTEQREILHRAKILKHLFAIFLRTFYFPIQAHKQQRKKSKTLIIKSLTALS